MSDRPRAVRDRLRAVLDEGGNDVAIFSVVLYELKYGAAGSGAPDKNMERLRRFLAGPMPFGYEDAVVAGELRAALEAKGTPIGPYDLLIAAQSLRSGATLVTANTSEFTRVKGLALENWTRS